MKRKVVEPERQTKWIQTSDEWYPTFPGPSTASLSSKRVNGKLGYVYASFIELSSGEWRVCVWGGDDFGMERDFESRVNALEVYRQLQNPCTVSGLKHLGFNRA